MEPLTSLIGAKLKVCSPQLWVKAPYCWQLSHQRTTEAPYTVSASPHRHRTLRAGSPSLALLFPPHPSGARGCAAPRAATLTGADRRLRRLPVVGAAALLQPRLGGRATVTQRAGAAADGGGRSVEALWALEAVVVAALPVHPAVAVLSAAALPAAAAQQPQQEAAQQQQPPPPRHRPALPARPGGARRGRPRVRNRVRGLPPPPDPSAPPPRGRSRPRRTAPRSPAAPHGPARPRALGGALRCRPRLARLWANRRHSSQGRRLGGRALRDSENEWAWDFALGLCFLTRFLSRIRGTRTRTRRRCTAPLGEWGWAQGRGRFVAVWAFLRRQHNSDSASITKTTEGVSYQFILGEIIFEMDRADIGLLVWAGKHLSEWCILGVPPTEMRLRHRSAGAQGSVLRPSGLCLLTTPGSALKENISVCFPLTGPFSRVPLPLTFFFFFPSHIDFSKYYRGGGANTD